MTTTTAWSRTLISSLAVFGIGAMLIGCGRTQFDATGSAPSSSMTSSRGFKDHSAATATLLGKAGLKLTDAQGSSLDTTAQILSFDGPSAQANVTFQPDNPVLRAQFDGINTLPDGTAYATQHAGYGGVSVAAFKGGRAVILTLIPKTLNGPVPMDDSAVVQGADSLVSGS